MERKHLWLIGMDLPEEKGTYVLISSVRQMKRIEIGRLGRFDIIPGYYAYVGSAFGAGGLRARLGHHLDSTAEPHWHIDYLLQVAQPVEIWYTTDDQKLEHHWADLLEKGPQFRIPIVRFGSSDYHRSRSSHLFYSKRRPAFAWFRQQLAFSTTSRPTPEVRLLTLSPKAPRSAKRQTARCTCARANAPASSWPNWR